MEELKKFIADLDSIGFENVDTPIDGFECVDVVCNHIDALRKLANK